MIEVAELSKRFGDRTVVDCVSFEAKKGELLVIVGGSGSGKTTTLKLINRLLEPSAGRVVIDGQDVSRLVPHELRRGIGYVFQEVGLFPHMSVEQNIGITLSLLGHSAERCKRRARELLELVELDPELGANHPAQLSGGQRQRVGVARALAAEPKVMLLDEPFGALDPLTRDRLQQTFASIRTQLGLTAVFVTHDMSEALTLADRIAVLRDGRLVQLGTPHELLTAPRDSYVERLLDTPRRQARALELALLGPTR
jgi:osmoprotectant transport system ATP-binding protein